MKIVIIGATAAGTTAAAKARRSHKEAEIVLYEQGEITSLGACGLPFFVGGQFDDPTTMIARTAEEFEQSGIKVHLHHKATAVDPKAKTVTFINLETNETLTTTYDKLMIATGASPILPNFAQGQTNLYSLRTLDDGIALKKAVNNPEIKYITIIGAGFIGLEVASELAHLGKKITIIDFASRVVSLAFDHEITTLMEAELRAMDIELRLGEGVEKLEGNPVTAVITNKGKIATDLVVANVGVRPATAWLKEAGFAMLPNGALIVNQHGQTNLPDIYAAGDCATVSNYLTKKPSYWPLATVANKLGRIVGENLAGLNTTLDGLLGSASIQIGALEAERTGLTEEEAIKEGFNISTVFITDNDHTNYYPVAKPLSIKLVYEKSSHRLLGGQIVGKQGAALRCHALTVAIMANFTTEQLGLTDFAYSPSFTRTWDALNVAGNVSR